LGLVAHGFLPIVETEIPSALLGEILDVENAIYLRQGNVDMNRGISRSEGILIEGIRNKIFIERV
jgi:hypothetical protein